MVLQCPRPCPVVSHANGHPMSAMLYGSAPRKQEQLAARSAELAEAGGQAQAAQAAAAASANTILEMAGRLQTAEVRFWALASCYWPTPCSTGLSMVDRLTMATPSMHAASISSWSLLSPHSAFQQAPFLPHFSLQASMANFQPPCCNLSNEPRYSFSCMTSCCAWLAPCGSHFFQLRSTNLYCHAPLSRPFLMVLLSCFRVLNASPITGPLTLHRCFAPPAFIQCCPGPVTSHTTSNSSRLLTSSCIVTSIRSCWQCVPPSLIT